MAEYTIHTPAPRVGRYQYTKATFVDRYPGKADEDVVDHRYCGRCGGTGRMPYTLDSGKCWGECGGRKGWSTPITAGELREADRKDLARENTALRASAKANHHWNHFLQVAVEAGYPQWLRALEVQEDGGFMNDLILRVRQGKLLSDRQVEAGAKSIDRYLTRDQRQAEAEAAKAQLAPLEEGRYVITGKVVKVKLQDGYYGSTWKMLLDLTTGHRVWGTVPDSLFFPEGERPAPGTQVQLTATVKRSEDDHTFGFYSRPAKATRLAE